MYRISLICHGVPRDHGAAAATDITEEFTHRLGIRPSNAHGMGKITSHPTQKEEITRHPTQNVAFIDEVIARGKQSGLGDVFDRIGTRRVPMRDAMNIHDILFYRLDHKKQYYPTRKDEEAYNPNGTRLR